MKTLFRMMLVPAAAALSACATVPESIVMQPTTAPAQPIAATPAANGAIFQAAAYRPMFEDRRARLVGDLLIISVNEKTNAGKQAASSGSKNGSVEASVPLLLNRPLNFLGASASTATKFEDKMSGSAGNNFSSAISVTVVKVLANGNLAVSGEKQIALDKGTEFIRFSGVVNPATIGAGNVVSSTQVADARIEYRANTRIDPAELMSGLARFFLSVLPL
ncbi:MAG: flagellar basal body L-ring protein FlgH [Pseudomonadota bacterium]